MPPVGILSRGAGQVTLALRGNVYAEMLPEIDRAICQSKATEKRVHLDLSEVALMDREAARFLAEQSLRGIELVNCPLYLTLWISPH
jgi:hypothetical protein